MRKLIYITFMISSILYSQIEKRSEYDVKSPNVSDFIRYGNIPVKMYTGELDILIPLINQSGMDLSLSYNSSGFIPSKRSGIVGLNWNLKGIGMISRELRGIPDDHIGDPTSVTGTNGRTGHGFMVGMKYFINAGDNLPNAINDNNIIILNDEIRHMGKNGGLQDSFETTPDIFYFEINGISGKFFMGSDGKIKVISNTPNIVTIDLSNFNFQPYTVICNPINHSEIKIIDDQGNKYYFGGESKHLEYSLSYNKTSQSLDATASNPTINTWYLKRIEYYNGKIVNYYYQNDEIGINSDFCFRPDTSWFKGPRKSSLYKRLFFMTENVFEQTAEIIRNGQSTYIAGSSNKYALNKKVFLDSITSQDFKLIFNYDLQGYYFNNNSNLYAFFKNIDEYRLTNIILKYGNQNIKKINFTYSLKGGTSVVNSYPRMFLESVHEEGKNPYSFIYDITPSQTLPIPSTCGVDFWGFYNGKLSNDAHPYTYRKLIPNVFYNSISGDETIIETIRDADFNFSKQGMLRRVTYPTGGYSEFEYEPQSYAKRLDKKSENSFLPALIDVSGISGGVRIKKIIDYDGINSTNIKEYLYINSNGVSSGVLMQWPRIRIDFNLKTHTPECYHQGVYYSSIDTNEDYSFKQSSSLNMNSVENSVMTYSRVVEKTTNGYKVFNFKDYSNYPDNSENLQLSQINKVGNLCGDLTIKTFRPENLVKNSHVEYYDRSIERGKLENILVYDNNNNLVQKEEYLYNVDTNRFNSNNLFAVFSNSWWYKSKQYFYSDFQTQKKITDYNVAGSITQTYNSIYISAPNFNPFMSSQDIVSKSSYTNSQNDYIETEYQYPWQNYTNTSNELLNFKNANFYNPIREKQTINHLNNTEKFTLFSKDVSTNNKLLPKSIYSAKFPNSLPYILNIGNLEKTLTYNQYDLYGNVTQFTPEGGMPTCIIWGYNNTLPVAKIENIIFSEINPSIISSIQTATNVINGYNEGNVIIALTALRTSFVSTNCFVTTYTHKPLIGVSTITDPKGDTQYYHYDSFNRLQYVKDKNGNILSENQYHYRD